MNKPSKRILKRRKVDTGTYTRYEYSTDPDFDGEPCDGIAVNGKEADLPSILRNAEHEIAEAHDRQDTPHDDAEWAAICLELLRGTLDDNDPTGIAEHAYQLGMAIERLRVRRAEHLAKSEKSRREGATGGKPGLTDNEKRRACELMREMFRNKLSKAAASKRVAALVAKEFRKEVDAKTIRGYWNEARNK